MAGRSCEAGSRTVTTWSSSTAHATQATHPSGMLCQLITNASTSAAPGRRRAHACPRRRGRTVEIGGGAKAAGEAGAGNAILQGDPWTATPVHTACHKVTVPTLCSM